MEEKPRHSFFITYARQREFMRIAHGNGGKFMDYS